MRSNLTIEGKEIMVSVLMITYNHEKYIEEAIRGILLQQVDFAVELLICNDASTDNTNRLIESCILDNTSQLTIRCNHHKQNIGMMANFIFGLEHCKGKYIALCEGDDYWTDPLKLKKQVDFLEANEKFVLSFHNTTLVNHDNNIIAGSKLLKDNEKDFDVDELLYNIYLPTPTLLFRNQKVKFPWYFSYSLNGDSLLLTILTQKGKAKFLPEIKDSHSRLHLGGVWSMKPKNYQLFYSLRTYLLIFLYLNPRKRELLFSQYYQIFKGAIEGVENPIVYSYFFKFNFQLFLFLIINKKLKLSFYCLKRIVKTKIRYALNVS
jgi:glycosyltransferase involved in cell wall biosynthesis